MPGFCVPAPVRDRTAFTQGSFAPEALPSFPALMSPCADPVASRPHFRLCPYRGRPCRLRHPRLVNGTVPILLCLSVLKCCAPYAGGPPGALDQFFPGEQRPSPCHAGLGFRPRSSHKRLLVGGRFRHGRHSFMLRPSSLLAPLTVRHRYAAPGDFYARACCRFVTSSTVEYATRPTGQLPGRNLRPRERQPYRLHRDGLPSYGSCRPDHRFAGFTQAQWAKYVG